MELRRKKGLFSVPLEHAENTPKFVESDPESHHREGEEKEDRLQELEQGIQKLGHEQRICIDLFYIQQMSYKGISEKTGYTLLQIKSHIQNGKRNLKIFIEKQNER